MDARRVDNDRRRAVSEMVEIADGVERQQYEGRELNIRQYLYDTYHLTLIDSNTLISSGIHF